MAPEAAIRARCFVFATAPHSHPHPHHTPCLHSLALSCLYDYVGSQERRVVPCNRPQRNESFEKTWSKVSRLLGFVLSAFVMDYPPYTPVLKTVVTLFIPASRLEPEAQYQCLMFYEI